MALAIQVLNLQNRTDPSNFYGIFEFVLIARKCETCISVTLLGSSVSLGIAFGVTTGVLIALSIILIAIVKLNNLEILRQFHSDGKGFQARNRFLDKLLSQKKKQS